MILGCSKDDSISSFSAPMKLVMLPSQTLMKLAIKMKAKGEKREFKFVLLKV